MIPRCVYCLSLNSKSEICSRVIRSGVFFRASDQKMIQRYHCKACRKSFSEARFSPCFRQKKRQYNQTLFKVLASGFSQRRAALTLNLNRKTVVRKFLFLGMISENLLKSLNHQYDRVSEMQFDDLETFEHTKCKPLSVTLAVEAGSRRILGFRVSRMPAKGLLAAISRKKYGLRSDERSKGRKELFQEIAPYLSEDVIIKSDQNPHYAADVEKYLKPKKHFTYKGRKGCVTGQGELKAGGFDPLFSLNHSFAMLRANINRLFRRTWNTTKIPQRLGYHIAIYAIYHNLVLIQK